MPAAPATAAPAGGHHRGAGQQHRGLPVPERHRAAVGWPRASKPVLVWVHGGGLANGAGSDFDAHRLAVSGDLVVVTVNYRLGALGFLRPAEPLPPPGLARCA